MTFKSTFEIVKTTLGATSIRDNRVGEILHNPVGPWKESRSLYVEQTDLKGRLLSPETLPLVLYDVGLGAGFNAMAAFEQYQSLKGQGTKIRDLHIISFENDLGLFDFALDEIQHFPENIPYRSALRELRKGSIYKEEGLTWELHGDVTKTSFPIPPAEVVFFDVYSPKHDPEMWSLNIFSLIQGQMNSRVPSCLVTYSVSTRIRAAMLLSGLYVGYGKVTGQRETTFAASTFEQLTSPLENRWLERWQRSHVALPFGNHGLTSEVIFERLKAHPQFCLKTTCKIAKERRE